MKTNQANLRKILDSLSDAQKADIKKFAGGHLNESKLLKQPIKFGSRLMRADDAAAATNSTAHTQPDEQLHALRHPVAKIALKTLTDTQQNKVVCQPAAAKHTHTQSSGVGRAIRRNRNRHHSDRPHSDRPHSDRPCSPSCAQSEWSRRVSELRPIRCARYPGRFEPANQRADATFRPIPMQMNRVKDFAHLLAFRRAVVKDDDNLERRLIAGDHIVAELEAKLREELESLEARERRKTRERERDEKAKAAAEHDDKKDHKEEEEEEEEGGQSEEEPNFARLNIMNDALDQVIRHSPLIGSLLQQIKVAYDAQIEYLLDKFPPPVDSLRNEFFRGAQTELMDARISNAQQLNIKQIQLRNLEEMTQHALADLAAKRDALQCATQQKAEAFAQLEREKETRRRAEKRKRHLRVESAPSESEQLAELMEECWRVTEQLEALRADLQANHLPRVVLQHEEEWARELELDNQKLFKERSDSERIIAHTDTEIRELITRHDMSLDDYRFICQSLQFAADDWPAHATFAEQFEAVCEAPHTHEQEKWSWYIS